MLSSLLLTLAFLLHGSPAKPPANALAYLTSIAQRYADAKSYYIAATSGQSSHNAFQRNWQKSLMTAIVAPGGRYHYEGRTGAGSAVAVSDGTEQWDYRPQEHEYAEKPVSPGEAAGMQPIAYAEMGVMQANNLVREIVGLPDSLKSASFLPDQKIVIGGRTIDCRVVHVTSADFKRQVPGTTTDETIWIDEARRVIVKTVRQGKTFAMDPMSNVRTPIEFTDTEMYTAVRLNVTEPASAFTFTPPPKAKLVASLQGNSFSLVLNHAPLFLGRPAPDILLERGGKKVALGSYRGKPVFIDFWGSTCGPCVAAMPELKELYAETNDKGMVWIGIDVGDNASTMDGFVKRERLPWPNYEDAGGKLSGAFGCVGLPLGVVINSSGKIVFYDPGYSVAMVRAAMARLGPEFSSLAKESAGAGTAAPRP